jgi:aryl-alcohol dehydrogenase-like predicted oxidoreductase
MDRRPLGKTDIEVSSVALGCWPIAGMTSLGVNDADSRATLGACRELGVNFLDTAYCYGAQGESERLIAPLLAEHRGDYVVATKGGIHWNADGRQAHDATPARLRWECDESLRRLGTDYVDLLYLHAPDPATPIAESAGALCELLAAGKTRAVGASNCSLAQLQEFAAVCPLAAIQPKYNMLQREIEAEILPWCQANEVSVMVYWPLLKGLIAGKLPRDHVFAPSDGRTKYPMFQGQEWHKNQDLVDELRKVAAGCGRTVAQVVVNWTIHRPGVTSALCGAKRAAQIRETAGAMGWRLSGEALAAIDAALARRGTPVSKNAV